MALARLKTWVQEVLTFADLNGEFNNILNNALSLISPLTGSLDVNSNDLTNVDEIHFPDAGTGATASGRLRRNGPRLTWHDGTALTRLLGTVNDDTTIADVTNTAVETTVYSFAMGGGLLASTRALRFVGIGDVKNNTAGNVVLTIRLKYGATTISTTAYTVTNVGGAIRDGIGIDCLLSAANATNAQVARTHYTFTTGGQGITGSATILTDVLFGVHASIAEDSTVAQTFAVTYQWASADANLSARLHAAHLYTE